MADLAIRANNISKSYQVGARERGYKTAREAIVDAFQAPFRRFRETQQSKEELTLWALRDISFEINAGQVVGIIGRNGAGKSTLLRVLSRITEPTTGRVEVYGRVASLLEVGTGFHPELTGRENIFLNGGILGMTRREIMAKFDEIVAFAEVERFIDTPVKRYSSGMYLRLAFAVSAHLEPDILVVDEVLAVGDATFRAKCMGKMDSVARQGRTVLFVSHDLSSLSKLCTHGLLLNKGHVEAAGDIADVVGRYLAEGVETTDGFADLSDRGDRSGDGAARFRSIEVLGDGQRTQTVSVGQSLRMNLEVEVAHAGSASQIIAIIATSDGVPVHDLASGECSWLSHEGRHHCAVEIDELRLYPGSYVVDLWIGDRAHDRVDYIRNAIRFEVVQTPQSGIDHALRRDNGLVYQPSAWSAVPDIARELVAR